MGKKLTLEQKEGRRKKGIALLKSGKRPAEVARELNVSRVSVGRWKDAYDKSGIKGVLSTGPLGRRSRLNESQKKKLGRLLLKGAGSCGYHTDLWTLKRINDLVRKHTGESYTPSGLWKLLQEMGFSSQRPTTKAIQRNEEEISRWKKEVWPRVKKKQNAKDG